MYWKCIGGPMDGTHFQIDGQKENFKIGNSFKVMGSQKKFKVLDYIPSLKEQQKEIKIDYYIYRLARFHFSKNDTY